MKRLILLAALVGLLAANLLLVPATIAHGTAHWNKWVSPGNQVSFYVYDTTDSTTDNVNGARNARIEWNDETILFIGTTNYHTEVSIYDGYDSRNIYGLMEPVIDAKGHYTHAHSWYNEKYNGQPANNIRLVFCQEIGHAWGLAHSEPNTGGCMGSQNYGVEQHNADDLVNKYSGSHSTH